MAKISFYRLPPDLLLKLLTFAYEEGVMGYMDLAEATADSILDKFVEEHPECIQYQEPISTSSVSPGSRSLGDYTPADQWSGQTEGITIHHTTGHRLELNDTLSQSSLSITEGEFQDVPSFSAGVQIVCTNMGSYPSGLETPWRTSDIREQNGTQESRQDHRGEAHGGISLGGDSGSPGSPGDSTVSG